MEFFAASIDEVSLSQKNRGDTSRPGKKIRKVDPAMPTRAGDRRSPPAG
jgi:hypothetical protein